MAEHFGPEESRRSTPSTSNRQAARGTRPSGIDGFDRDMVEFTLQWTPFGHPPAEDIFIRFGMSMPQFYRRLRTVVRTQIDNRLHGQDLMLISYAAQLLGRSIYDCQGMCDHTCSCPRDEEAQLRQQCRNVRGVWRWV